jgi:hypothetical protein
MGFLKYFGPGSRSQVEIEGINFLAISIPNCWKSCVFDHDFRSFDSRIEVFEDLLSNQFFFPMVLPLFVANLL